MKKALVFGASNSQNSINKKFAVFAAVSLTGVELDIADLNDYLLPVYSIDLEKEMGVHDSALKFYDLIKQSDAIVISMAEYNGLHTAAFKNLWDWMSRIPLDKPMQIWDGKPMFLLSTSPSQRPMSNVLRVSKELFPHFGAKIIADFHLPSFNHFFINNEIVDQEQLATFEHQKNKFQIHLDNLISIK
ncbi:MAG: NAD(P)H-dependent oxidoreductase [Bacteroidota bacterium]